jgi:hypothetical protein
VPGKFSPSLIITLREKPASLAQASVFTSWYPIRDSAHLPLSLNPASELFEPFESKLEGACGQEEDEEEEFADKASSQILRLLKI